MVLKILNNKLINRLNIKLTVKQGIKINIFTFLLLLNINAGFAFETKAPGTPNPKDSTNMNLTDQQRFTSQNYLHDGLNTRTYNAECAKIGGNSTCQGQGDVKALGIDSGLMTFLPMVYSMIVGQLGDGNFKLKKDKSVVDSQSKAPDNSSKVKKEDKKKTDYCKYIPMAGEMVAMTTGATAGKTLQIAQQKSQNAQYDSLYNAAKEHENRAKTAQIQQMTWGSAAACYAAYGAFGSIDYTDTTYLIKLAGSSVFAMYYTDLIKKNKERAATLRAIAAKLPKAGDCNPITDKSCYCAQPETMYDKQYCLDQIQKAQIADGYFSSCVDSKLQNDPTCNCKDTNTCYDQTFLNQIGTVPFGNSFANSPAGVNFQNLTKGKVGSAIMKGNSNGSNAFKNFNLKNLPTPKHPLTKKQNRTARSLSKLGIPARVAALVASAPIPKGAKKYSSRFRGFAALRKGSYGKRRKRSKIYRYGTIQKHRKYSHRENFNMSKFLHKKNKNSKNSNIYRFAKKAEAQAQINQDSSKPIFEIISRRYKITAWKSLQWQ